MSVSDLILALSFGIAMGSFILYLHRYLRDPHKSKTFALIALVFSIISFLQLWLRK